MDKKYVDIIYENLRINHRFIVIREVILLSVENNSGLLKIKYKEKITGDINILVVPVISGYSLIIS